MTHALVTQLLAAQAEGLAPNARRFLAFVGPGPLELQILGGREKWAENKYAHPTSVEDTIPLLEQEERQGPAGIYVILNEPDEAVTTRDERNAWHAQKKGGVATKDNDIVARRGLYVDIDWARATGTSTTDEQCMASIEGAALVLDRIARAVPPSSLGLGHSGNCGAVHVALDRIPETPAVAALIKEALAVLHLLFTDPRIQADKQARNGLEIDRSVCDAKRLCPAYGTTKRKGVAKLADRPHRRTAFICSDTPHRLTLPELEALVQDLRGDLTAEQLVALDKDLGRKPAAAAPATRSATAPRTTSRSGPDPFLVANRTPPVADVLSWLGLLQGEQPTCPGCGESDGSSVAIVGNGLKCLHNRCSSAGKAGFRSVVDIVSDHRRCTPLEAVRELADRFGFEAPAVRTPRQPDPDREAAAREDGPAEPREATSGHDAPADPDYPIPSDEAPQPAAATGLVGDWTGKLKRDKWGTPKSTYGNLCIVLRHAYGKRLAFDTMCGAPCFDGAQLSEGDIGRVREELEQHYSLVIGENDVVKCVRQIAEERKFHPVRDYLTALKWDVKVRIPTIVPRLFGNDDPLATRMLTAWFAQTAARVLQPGCKADAAVVLIGKQGWFKSSFFAILAGQWFSDSKMDISNKDSLMQLARTWIYEWGELENVTSRKQASEIKAFITSQYDNFRPPFAKAPVNFPRSGVIVGSTNEQQFLNDPTGSRRFWCIKLARSIPLDGLAWLREMRDQIWAEAVTNVQSGYQAYLTLEEELAREELAEEHQVHDAYQDRLADWLNGPEGHQRTAFNGWVTTGDLLEGALKIDAARWDRATQIRVGHCMKRLKWEHVRRRLKDDRAIWVYLRPERPPDGGYRLEPT